MTYTSRSSTDPQKQLALCVILPERTRTRPTHGHPGMSPITPAETSADEETGAFDDPQETVVSAM